MQRAGLSLNTVLFVLILVLLVGYVALNYYEIDVFGQEKEETIRVEVFFKHSENNEILEFSSKEFYDFQNSLSSNFVKTISIGDKVYRIDAIESYRVID